ncbi:DNA polymerase I [Silvibacterium dinghuense]|uniref:DNA polymerase I n=1 Tax=Silvibacterium dinghuense TaxID=1560006 RepID=A0A4Q1SEQ4_9BACT|nr:DNA polymerase I [Silvibacterium dinghuense]RXS95613.1 DNA polymerase I [Silvibacterium dinghuense]GGH14413.1 DNA polymerase I [Silvibacterium dinghuense]
MSNVASTAAPVYLLDSMSFIFRAYHAMQRQRPMSTRTGVPTAATYVFVNMINKLRKDFGPEYFAAVFDLSGPVFRDERAKTMTTVRKFNIKTQQFDEVEYGGYKANRAEMPADLAQQLPYIRRALEAFHIPIVSAEGFEADDVIGTLSRKAAEAGHPVYVVSNDKDMLQLVTDSVKILNPAKDNLVLDRDKVVETLGVPPEQVIDVMALRGDSIDNIPGAPGIGDKGSIELIQQFGSVEAALDRASEVKRKTYRESLENNRDTVLLSKELVTIHCSVPIELDLEKMRTTAPDIAACRALFTELEFTTMLKELAPAEVTQAYEHLLEPTLEQFAAFEKAARESGFAIAVGASALESASGQVSEQESEGIEEREPVYKTMSLLDLVEKAAQKDVDPRPAKHKVAVAAEADAALLVELDAIRSLLEDESIPKRVHDLKGSLRALEAHGVTLRGAQDDLMLYSYLVNPTHTTHRLSDVAARFSTTPLRETGERELTEAAHAIHALTPTLREDVDALEERRLYETIDLPLVPILFEMEKAGVRIDSALLNRMGETLSTEMQRVGEEIFTQSGHRFNINSPKQLGDVLFNKMNLPKPLKYGKGKVVSTAQDVLEELAEHNAVPRLVLEYRQLAKLKSNYVDSLPLLADSEGRVHTTFNQVGTATGRLSSTNPNLQNIPVRTELGREIRAAFIAAPGNRLISADYSQIELRLMAHFSADPLLVEAYRTGKDIHTLTASEVFGVPAENMSKETRNRAKAVNFGIVYGISPFGLAAQLGIEQNEARLYIETYFERYKGVRAFIDSLLETTRAEQRVRTLFGRIRPIPDIQSRNANLRGFAERTAVNTPLQGTAADLIKLAMIRIDAELTKRKLGTRMILQVHDELLFDVPEAEVAEVAQLVKHQMEHVIELSVPLVAEVGIGANWRDLK